MPIEFRDDMIAGDWRSANHESALSEASRAARGGPTMREMFSQSWDDSVKVSNQNAAQSNFVDVVKETADKITAATGVKDLFVDDDLNMPFFENTAGAPSRSRTPVEIWNANVAAVRAKHPDALNWDEVLAEPQRRMLALMRQTRERSDKMSQQAGMVEPGEVPLIGNIPVLGSAAALTGNLVSNPGLTLAQIAGGLGGQMTSPVDAASNLVGGLSGSASKSLLNNALRNAISNAAIQMPLSAAKMGEYQEAGLPHGWRVWLSEVEGAAGTGAALDAGIRGAVRGGRRLAGQTSVMEGGREVPLGGMLQDAVPEARIAPAPKLAPLDIKPETFDAASKGDLVATREILEKTHYINDPEVRGALAHAETIGKLDAEQLARLKEIGVQNHEGMRVLDGLVSGRYTRPADLDADLARMQNPLPPALPDANVERVVSVAKADLDRIAPQMSELVTFAVEGRVPEIEGPVRTALARLDAKEDARTVSRELAGEILTALKDDKTAARIGAVAKITSGMVPAAEIAQIVQAQPELRYQLNGEIGRHSDALALASLDESNLGRVLAGDVPTPVAVHIANHVRPESHATAFDDMARMKPQSVEEAVRMLDEMTPGEPRASETPLDRSGGLDDPLGADAKAHVESLKQEAGDALKAAQEPIRERDKVSSRAETAKGELAKLEEKLAKADITDADATAIAKKRAEIHEAETRHAQLQAELNPDKEAALELYRIAMVGVAERRALDVHLAVAHAVAVGRAIAPDGTRIEVRSDELRDTVTGRLLDAYYVKGESTITLARYATDPAARVSHEVVHALVDRGALSSAEMKLLAQEAAKTDTVFGPEKRKQYAEAYADRQNVATLLDEEAAAHLIDARVKGTVKGGKNTMQGRTAQTLERARNLFKGYGFKSADDVVAAVLSGEAARREPVRRWMRENDVSAMAVKPQPMFAIVDMSVGQSMRRDLDALGYRSAALEAARSLKQTKGTPEQMLAQLRSAGVKQAEIDATNLPAFLDGKKSITRDEIVGHLEANRVGLNEKTYGARAQFNPSSPVHRAAYAVDRAGGDVERAAKRLRDDIAQFPNDPDTLAKRETLAAIEAGNVPAMEDGYVRSMAGSQPTKWSSYSLDPSNPTYRETVIHLPTNEADMRAKYRAELESIYGPRLGPGQFSEEKFQEWMKSPHGLGQLKPNFFLSGHFSEPNIVGHMMTSMTRHEGQPVYTIDQIQSDWGQKLRDGGVRDEGKIAELRKRVVALSDAIDAIPDRWQPAPKEGAYRGVGEVLSPEAQKLQDEFDLVRAELATAEATSPGHPLVNTTDQWTVTTLRRALRQAAEAGAEFIAIPHGDTVLSYNPGDKNGMRGFYGSRTSEGIVPKNLRKMLEKIDKTVRPFKVDKLETSHGLEGWKGEHKERSTGRRLVDDRQMHNESRIDKAETGFTLFPLTDKVKAEILDEGQPMFAFAGPKAKTADLEALNRAKEMEAEGTDRNVIWSETGWGKFPGGKWLFETDDSGSTLGKDSGKLRDVLKNQPLFDAYPEIGGIKTRPITGIASLFVGGGFREARGLKRLFGSRGEIIYSEAYQGDARRSKLLHEAKHAVEPIEGLPIGGSQRDAANGLSPQQIKALVDAEEKRLIERAEVWNPAGKSYLNPEEVRRYQNEYDTQRSTARSRAESDVNGLAYNALAGEVLARAVETRMDMTPEERRARPPWLDYDVPEEQQIVRFADGTSVSQKSYSSEPPVQGFPTIKGNVMFAIRAYHGSPHDFDRFELSKIGTGEGAQAYGHGLYFAESESIARWYRDALAHKAPKRKGAGSVSTTPEDFAREFISVAGWRKSGVKEAAIQNLKELIASSLEDLSLKNRIFDREYYNWTKNRIQVVQKAVELIEQDQIAPAGRLYEVRINAEPEDFLDWDKPLAQQSEKVRHALQSADRYMAQPEYLNYAGGDMWPTETAARGIAEMKGMADATIVPRKQWSGQQGFSIVVDRPIGENIRKQVQDKDIASSLREAGIPGIRYLDAGSRTAGEGSRNYVVFDDKLIEIVAKDGKPIESEERKSVIDGMMGEKEDGTSQSGPKSGPMFAMADETPPKAGQEPQPVLRQEYAALDRMNQVRDLIEACAA